jgi:hypothetical protein
MRSSCVISRPVCSMYTVAVCLSWWRALRCRNNPQSPPGFMLVSLRGHNYAHRTPPEGLNPSSRWLLPSASALRDLAEGQVTRYRCKVLEIRKLAGSPVIGFPSASTCLVPHSFALLRSRNGWHCLQLRLNALLVLLYHGSSQHHRALLALHNCSVLVDRQFRSLMSITSAFFF